MTKLRLLAISVAAGFAGGLYFGSATAQIPTPNTYLDLLVPALTGWSDVNTLTVPTADVAVGRTYIYPDAAARDADVAGDGTGSVTFIGWKLDDLSGRAPGIQVVTDDFAFPVQNCIMASGERESQDFPGTIVPKTCSDDEGSSKRFFTEVTEADVPIDFVFNTGVRTLRYKGVKDDDGGAAYEAFRDEFGTGRIYRMIQKIVNDTDERLVGFKVELGFGIGDDFEPASFDEHGVAFELRSMVPRQFFVGSTGADARLVWDPERFALFSRKFFFGPEPTTRFPLGFFDDRKTAGLSPPQSAFDLVPEHPSTGGQPCSACHNGINTQALTVQQQAEVTDKPQFIYSGEDFFDGRYGAMTRNYFDMLSEQAAGIDIAPYLFGYFLPEEIAPVVIGEHTDGDPATEPDKPMAWWDGQHWRYGVGGDVMGLNPFGVVGPEQLTQWANLPLGYDAEGLEAGPRYEAELSDDLSAVNVEYFIYLGENFVEYSDFVDGIPRSAAPISDRITLRLTAVSVDAINIGSSSPGAGDPPWVDNPAPDLAEYMTLTGPVAFNDSAQTVGSEPVVIAVLENDLLDREPFPDDPGVPVVVNVTAPENGGAVVLVDNTVEYTANEPFVGRDFFTYTVTVGAGTDALTSNVATVTVDVLPPPVPSAPIARNDSARTIGTDPVTIDVLANDSFEDGSPIPAGASVDIRDNPLWGSAAVTQLDSGVMGITYTPEPADVQYFDRFTYTVTYEGAKSNAALVTVDVQQPEVVEPPAPPVEPPEEPAEDDPPEDRTRSSSSGCTMGNAQSKDPILPMLALLSLIYLVRRRLVRGS